MSTASRMARMSLIIVVFLAVCALLLTPTGSLAKKPTPTPVPTPGPTPTPEPSGTTVDYVVDVSGALNLQTIWADDGDLVLEEGEGIHRPYESDFLNILYGYVFEGAGHAGIQAFIASLPGILDGGANEACFYVGGEPIAFFNHMTRVDWEGDTLTAQFSLIALSYAGKEQHYRIYLTGGVVTAAPFMPPYAATPGYCQVTFGPDAGWELVASQSRKGPNLLGTMAELESNVVIDIWQTPCTLVEPHNPTP